MLNASIQTGRRANQPGAQFICNQVSCSQGTGLKKSNSEIPHSILSQSPS